MSKKFNTTWIQPKKPDNFDVQNHDLLYKQKAFDLPSIKLSIPYHCSLPWNTLTIDEQGRIFTCMCDGWVPFSVGTITDFLSFEEIFESQQAKLTQESVIKKEYNYCATKNCGIEIKDISVPDGIINLYINLDVSCNLSCPSCRERVIFLNDENLLEQKMKAARIIHSWLIKSQKKVIISFGGGDPFASLIYIDMIKLFSTVDNVFFIIKTNGLLLKKYFLEFNKLIKKINEISVSIDAASATTYEITRRGGKWNTLLENLEYLKSLNIGNDSANNKNYGNFVIQRDNIDDVLPFIDFCNYYKLIPNFSIVQDWGTWHNYKEHCVHLPDSPHYEKFKQIITSPVFEQNNVDIRGIKQWI